MLLFALTSEEPKTQETADDTSKSEEGNWQAASHSFIYLFFYYCLYCLCVMEQGYSFIHLQQ